MTKEELEAVLNDTLDERIKSTVKSAVEQNRGTSTERLVQLLEGAGTAPQNPNPKEKGIGAARTVRCLAMGRGDPEKAQRIAKRFQEQHWKDELGDHVCRALQAGDLGEAGFLVEPEFSQEIIEFLYNRTVVRRAGARSLPMNNGSLTLPKQTSSASASYVGEARRISNSQPGGGHIVMTAKKLAALVPITNDLLTFTAGGRADSFVRDDVVSRISVREDQAFIRGDGTENTPRGFKSFALAAQTRNSGASSATDSAGIEEDFKQMWQALESSNIPMDRVAWFMSPRTKTNLFTLRDDAGGQKIFPEVQGANPTIWDRPVFTTNNIPTNLGGGNDETEIYLVNMDDVIIGEDGGLEIDVSSEATYHDGSDVISAFESDQTLVRAITRHDLAVRHNESIAITDQVSY